jgi:hypothetical protein
MNRRSGYYTHKGRSWAYTIAKEPHSFYHWQATDPSGLALSARFYCTADDAYAGMKRAIAEAWS